MILVTGGHGFIGSRVTRLLTRRGHPVRLLVRPTSDLSRVSGCETVLGDVRDREAVNRAFEGCEGALHLASPSSWADHGSPALPAIVVEGTRHVVEAAAGRRVVLVSSVAALGGSWHPQVLDETARLALPDNSWWAYAWAKHRAELLCAGKPVVTVNPGEVYGPDDIKHVTCGTLLDFARGNPVLVSRGGTSVVHVDDVAAGIVAAWERGRLGERYLLGGDNLTIVELARLTLAIMGRKQLILKAPAPLLMLLARFGLATGLPVGFEPRVAPYANRFWFCSSQKARHELGLTFRSARDTLQDTLDWLRP